MTDGEPLNDDDRHFWLVKGGEWLASCHYGAMVSCSALKRTYRNQVHAHCPHIE
ncbi:hypothetical protein [Mycobacterium leprae]|uniref:hypothetical protein n=1 Tax=Mycobacterium leprae TaxID=1769 RepID=UPI0002D63362|nr:hypothetical protein [Mycobacterium leprae]